MWLYLGPAWLHAGPANAVQPMVRLYSLPYQLSHAQVLIIPAAFALLTRLSWLNFLAVTGPLQVPILRYPANASAPHKGEDPFVWKTARGWHLLTHNQEGPMAVSA